MARRRVMSLLTLLLTMLFAASTIAESKCLCQASGCLCCVELNLTSSIDLGGPACVNVHQNERNVSLNLSYADNSVHNATIALDNAAHIPTCMNLLSDLAQICAEFISIKVPIQEEHSYEGCLVIEPALLGAPQATYPVGCFTFDRGQVRQIENPTIKVKEKLEQKPDHEQVLEEDPEQEDEEEDSGLNAEELIAAVSASAEQGIVLFSQWLGLNLSPRFNTTNGSNTDDESVKLERPIINMNFTTRHGRTITVLVDNEDKSDERFKQLLSAQDNILKESATIGESSSGLATSFFYSQPDAEELRTSNLETIATISPENLAVVSSESRRGGRAYSIHQHVNEI